MMMLFFGSLDFFASFLHQGKNEEPSRLKAKSKPNNHFSSTNPGFIKAIDILYFYRIP